MKEVTERPATVDDVINRTLEVLTAGSTITDLHGNVIPVNAFAYAKVFQTLCAHGFIVAGGPLDPLPGDDNEPADGTARA